MAIRNKSLSTGLVTVEAIPKKTRQGNGNHTKYAATSRNHKKKAYRYLYNPIILYIHQD